jgi:hypothetical protein
VGRVHLLNSRTDLRLCAVSLVGACVGSSLCSGCFCGPQHMGMGVVCKAAPLIHNTPPPHTHTRTPPPPHTHTPAHTRPQTMPPHHAPCRVLYRPPDWQHPQPAAVTAHHFTPGVALGLLPLRLARFPLDGGLAAQCAAPTARPPHPHPQC